MKWLLIVALAALPVTALAGNARSDRSARQFYRDRYQAAVINSQWANHFARQRQDEANYWRWKATGESHAFWSSRHAQGEQQSRDNFRKFIGNGPVISIPGVLTR